MHIEIPYIPRPLQDKLHTELDKYRFAVLACHRRWGKTVMLINHLLRSALTNKLKNPRYAYIAPTYRQAKQIAYDYLKMFAGGIPGAMERIRPATPAACGHAEEVPLKSEI